MYRIFQVNPESEVITIGMQDNWQQMVSQYAANVLSFVL